MYHFSSFYSFLPQDEFGDSIKGTGIRISTGSLNSRNGGDKKRHSRDRNESQNRNEEKEDRNITELLGGGDEHKHQEVNIANIVIYVVF